MKHRPSRPGWSGATVCNHMHTFVLPGNQDIAGTTCDRHSKMSGPQQRSWLPTSRAWTKAFIHYIIDNNRTLPKPTAPQWIHVACSRIETSPQVTPSALPVAKYLPSFPCADNTPTRQTNQWNKRKQLSASLNPSPGLAIGPAKDLCWRCHHQATLSSHPAAMLCIAPFNIGMNNA